MKIIEIRRHAPDDDQGCLTREGRQLAMQIGESDLRGRRFAFAMGTDFFRTIETLTMFAHGAGDWRIGGRYSTFVLGPHDPWYAMKRVLRRTENGRAPIQHMLEIDRPMVEREAVRLAAIINNGFDSLRDGEEGIIVIHSEVIEIAVFGLVQYETHRTVDYCEGFRLTRTEDGSTRVEEIRYAAKC